jgi:hypothetical protein
MPTPREHALRVAALDALSAAVKAEYEHARKDAEDAFRAARADGARQQEVLLPDGTAAGLIAIKEGGTTVTPIDSVLLAWVREYNAGGIEEYIEPSALVREDVAEVVKAVFPELVTQRIRPSVKAAYMKQAEAADGWLEDKGTGEKAQVAKVVKNDPTGEFAFAGGKTDQRRAAVMAALQSDRGLRAEILGGALALTSGDDTEAAK